VLRDYSCRLEADVVINSAHRAGITSRRLGPGSPQGTRLDPGDDADAAPARRSFPPRLALDQIRLVCTRLSA